MDVNNITEEEIESLRDEYENKETTLYQAIEFIVAMEEGDKEKSLADDEMYNLKAIANRDLKPSMMVLGKGLYKQNHSNEDVMIVEGIHLVDQGHGKKAGEIEIGEYKYMFQQIRVCYIKNGHNDIIIGTIDELLKEEN